MTVYLKREPTAADYRELLVKARMRQLRGTRENLQRLEKTFDAAARSLIRRIGEMPADSFIERAQRGQLIQLYHDTRAILDALRNDYGTLLQASMLDSAQDAAQRELETAALVGADIDPDLEATLTRTLSLSAGGGISVQFGRVSLRAVEAAANRYYRDGLRLSDRLYNLDSVTRKAVEDTILQGITEQVSAPELADRLQAQMQTPRHNAMRIARTEIRQAYTEGTVRSVLDAFGRVKPYIQGLRFALSLSHPAHDICDVYAAHDGGLGVGTYLPADFPVSHPHCLCACLPVLKAYPEVSIPKKTPNPGAIPESELRRYAAQGDAAARALLEAKPV